MEILIGMAIALVAFPAMIIGTFCYAFRRIRVREDKVLQHLPEDKREEARRQLGDFSNLLWPGCHDLRQKMTQKKQEFLQLYEKDGSPELPQALATYISEAWYERDRARGGPLSGAHEFHSPGR